MFAAFLAAGLQVHIRCILIHRVVPLLTLNQKSLREEASGHSWALAAKYQTQQRSGYIADPAVDALAVHKAIPLPDYPHASGFLRLQARS